MSENYSRFNWIWTILNTFMLEGQFHVLSTWNMNWYSALSDFKFFFFLCGETLGTAATTGLLYQPRMIGDGDCGEICGMKIGRGNQSTRRKPAPAPLCPPQIPHDWTRVWTRAAAVGRQLLTAWAMARPAWELSNKTFPLMLETYLSSLSVLN
jgi:hypothetical protein